ncbi:MAG: hypothetical protein NWR47_03895 [Aestuariivirgaceae bacterium]|nr:hypothetical protein [Aestuariivirgaceae bacterium]
MIRSLFAALLLTATPALAQEGPSSITADWNGDGWEDSANFTQMADADFVGIEVYLSDAQGNQQLAVSTPYAAWSGQLYGTKPWLELNERGSLQIMSGNDAIGRGRWSQTVTVAYRKGQFNVIGITRTEWDTLDPDFGHSCDLNLATRKGVVNDEAVQAPAFITLPDWNFETSVPDQCFSEQ